MSEIIKLKYQQMAEWVGLGGPKPDDASLALYLMSELGNREEVDAVESAVTVEAIKALSQRPASLSREAALATERDALVSIIMRGSHREARDLARARFVAMNPDEKGHAAKLAEGIPREAALREALEKACGYLTNAAIDLQTGAPKRTALNTIEGGLKMVRDALAQGTPTP